MMSHNSFILCFILDLFINNAAMNSSMKVQCLAELGLCLAIRHLHTLLFADFLLGLFSPLLYCSLDF
jgi:hypothetical protein